MKIRVPYFAQDWRDEGILTFAAFALRVCDQVLYRGLDKLALAISN